MSEWCRSMEAATGLGLPWRMLRDKLVTLDPETQLVKYSTTFDKLSDNNKSVSTKIPFKIIIFAWYLKESAYFQQAVINRSNLINPSIHSVNANDSEGNNEQQRLQNLACFNQL